MSAVETARGDLRLGLSQGAEDLAIAALVVSPFTLTLAVFLGWATWAPSLVLMAVWLVAQVAATLWNAGWRARDA